jgi:DDE superfamily endonuclease
VLLFSDESETLTHPYLARAWAKRGADLRVPAPGQSKKVAMMGTFDWCQRKLIITTSRTKRSSDFIAPASARSLAWPQTWDTHRPRQWPNPRQQGDLGSSR